VGDKPNIDVKIAHLAGRQQRNVTRRQLLAIGVAGSSIDWRVKIGRLFREHPGVYSVGCPATTPLERAMAAVLACGPGAVLSHGSALTLWGIWKRWDTPFDVITRTDRRPKGIKVHRAQKLDRRDFTRHHGIPVTTLARTLLDQAPRLTAKSLTRAVNDGRLNGHLRPTALAEVVERHPTHRGAAKLRSVLGLATERPTRSTFEDRFPAFCRRYALPTPQINATVCGYEVDALFPEEKVIVELDSWGFHWSRTSFESDRKQDADTTAAGFVTVRITWERFERKPDEEAAGLHAILARRRRGAP
jgi:very-short-patch-repair endonuclease